MNGSASETDGETGGDHELAGGGISAAEVGCLGCHSAVWCRALVVCHPRVASYSTFGSGSSATAAPSERGE